MGNCELRLSNNRFGTNRSLDQCPPGQLNGISRGVSKMNDSYISNLNFTAVSNVSNVTVKCFLDAVLFGTDIVEVITGMCP